MKSLMLILGVLVGSAATSASSEVYDYDTQLPLKPTRTIEFTTDEGTWMSVDVSPDGKTLVFDVLGDLYLLPIEGGQARPLTSGTAFDLKPRFSPDGKSVAFISDRNGGWNLWVMGADGSAPRAVTKGSGRTYCSVIWQKNQSALVSASTGRLGGSSLAAYPLDRGAPTILKEVESTWFPCLNLSGPELSADEQHLYYTVGGLKLGQAQIERMQLDTKVTRKLTDALGGALRPLLSHDGRLLVYATREVSGQTSLRVRDLNTGEERWLIRGVQLDAQVKEQPPGDILPDATFTPDDRAVIASHGGKLWRIDVATGRTLPIPFQVQVRRKLGPLLNFDYPLDDKTVTTRRLRFPRLSPDGEHVVFHAIGSLWVADLNNGKPRRLTPPEARAIEAIWSPDGRHVIYTTWDEATGGAIFRIGADGRGAVQRLTTEPAFFRDLTATPDGERLIFRRVGRPTALAARSPLTASSTFNSGRGGSIAETHLSSMPIVGGSIISIVAVDTSLNNEEHGEPHFVGPDRRLFYRDAFPDSPFGSQLVSVRADGTDRRQEIKAIFDDIKVSPSGDRALIVSRISMQVHLFQIPSDAARPIDLTTITFPSDSSATPGAAEKLKLVSRTGADFIGWNVKGDGFFYSLGDTVFRYDLARFEREGAAYRPKTTQIQVSVPAARPAGSIVLRGARIVTMREDEVIERGDVLIRNNRIVAVGATGKVEIPPGVRELDVRGKTITPGWVDLHAHFLDYEFLLPKEFPGHLAHLAFGVTALRNPGPSGLTHFSYADETAAGIRLGPRMFSTGDIPYSFAPEGARNVADVREIMRRHAHYWKTETFKQYSHGDRLTRQWIAMAAQDLRLTPTNEREGLMSNLTMAVDGYAGLEHTLSSVVPVYEDVVQLMARSGIVWTPTLIALSDDYRSSQQNVLDDPRMRQFVPDIWWNVRGDKTVSREERDIVSGSAAVTARIVGAGGRVGLGSHGNVPGIGVHWELWDIASNGMRPHDALRVATIFGAEAIGHEKDFGSIEPGKLADLLVLDKNPLEDIQNTLSIRYVMKGGFLYESETLDQVWPKSVPLERQWWQDDDTAQSPLQVAH